VLGRIFGPKREEVEGKWSQHNEDLHKLYTSPNIIRVINSRRMRWARHVASIKGKDYSEDLGVDEKIILEWILEKQGGISWIDYICASSIL